MDINGVASKVTALEETFDDVRGEPVQVELIWALCNSAISLAEHEQHAVAGIDRQCLAQKQAVDASLRKVQIALDQAEKAVALATTVPTSPRTPGTPGTPKNPNSRITREVIPGLRDDLKRAEKIVRMILIIFTVSYLLDIGNGLLAKLSFDDESLESSVIHCFLHTL